MKVTGNGILTAQGSVEGVGGNESVKKRARKSLHKGRRVRLVTHPDWAIRPAAT
jgi:hypothetical protein